MNSVHPSEDDFESYLLGRLEGSALENFEEHLLLCEICRQQLEETEEYVKVMRAGLSRTGAHVWQWPKVLSWARDWRVGAAGAILASVAVVLMVMAPLQESPAQAFRDVHLESSRGVEPAAELKAGWGANLRAEVNRVEPQTAYSFEVAGEKGDVVWTGLAQIEGTRAVARMDRVLPPGKYWVRLFGTSRRLLREYPLQVRP